MKIKFRYCIKSNVDFIYFFLLLLLLIGLPLGIKAYDRSLEPQNLPPGTKSFSLVGNAQKGWQLGDLRAHRTLSFGNKTDHRSNPVIEVELGDLVMLKLRSSDITHGFSLKAFGIYLADGIEPGKTVYVSFKADKTGTFIFACNVFCGDIHQHMQGQLVVK